MNNNWYVITGGPSTGKSTLLQALADAGYQTVQEAARIVIDEAVAAGISVAQLRADEADFQERVARLKIATSMELDPLQVTFFDRGLHDSQAYMQYYNYAVPEWLERAAHAISYQQVFLLNALPNYEVDYARTEDASFRVKIHSLLRDTYTRYGMTSITIPSMSVDERLRKILLHINGEPSA